MILKEFDQSNLLEETVYHICRILTPHMYNCTDDEQFIMGISLSLSMKKLTVSADGALYYFPVFTT